MTTASGPGSSPSAALERFRNTLTGGTVAENAARGTVVGTVHGVDGLPGAVLTYALLNDAGGRFAIDANTGVITVADGSLLDFETAAAHGISVKVTDQTGQSFTKTFTVNVTNVNEAPTNETLSGGSVLGGSANGTVVGTVQGTDPDAGSVLTYSLIDNAGGAFAINANTGVITVADGSKLNPGSAAVTVRVTDQGGLSFDKTFGIAIDDPAQQIVAANEHKTVNEDNSLVISAASLIADSSNPSGLSLDGVVGRPGEPRDRNDGQRQRHVRAGCELQRRRNIRLHAQRWERRYEHGDCT